MDIRKLNRRDLFSLYALTVRISCWLMRKQNVAKLNYSMDSMHKKHVILKVRTRLVLLKREGIITDFSCETKKEYNNQCLTLLSKEVCEISVKVFDPNKFNEFSQRVHKEWHRRLGMDAKQPSAPERFPTPPGTIWNQVHITILGNSGMATISVGHKPYTKTFVQMGFGDIRTKNKMPMKLWDILTGFAVCSVGITSTTNEKVPVSGKKTISRLREKLQYYFGIKNDPFELYRREKKGKRGITIIKSYTPKFIITEIEDDLASDPSEKEFAFNEASGRYDKLPGVKQAKYRQDPPDRKDDLS